MHALVSRGRRAVRGGQIAQLQWVRDGLTVQASDTRVGLSNWFWADAVLGRGVRLSQLDIGRLRIVLRQDVAVPGLDGRLDVLVHRVVRGQRGGAIERLSKTDGVHNATFATNASVYVDNWSNPTTPPQLQL